MTHAGFDDIDPASFDLTELRRVRADLQHRDDVVSYVRRLSQVRLDLVRAEQARRAGSGAAAGAGLPAILGTHLVGGAARPPRPADDFSDHPLAVELDELCRRGGCADLEALDDEELAAVERELAAFEQARSAERRALFGRIDALSAELVRRYRDGEADPAALLDD